MEIFMRTPADGVLVLTCCLIIAPTVTTPIEDLNANPDDTHRVSRARYLTEDFSDGRMWTHNYPQFANLLQEKQSEAKRRSSFIPVRGKKFGQIFYDPIAPEEIITDRTFLPSVKRASRGAYDVSANGRGYVQRFPMYAAANASGASDLVDSLGFIQQQKRASAFMPMRGRKWYSNSNSLALLKRYLAARGVSSKLAFRGDEINFPAFHEKGKKDETHFLDQDEMRLLLDAGDVRRHSLEETEHNDDSSNQMPLTREKVAVGKRALSFVPTRGRRDRLGELTPEFQLNTGNPTKYVFQADGESPQRYRRAPAFLPMRGRKSSESSHWLPYGSLAKNVDRMQSIGEAANQNNVEKQSPETHELVFAEDSKYSDGRREKKSYSYTEDGLLSLTPQQDFRTALVMKRPLSFFAARGKRLTGNEVNMV